MNELQIKKREIQMTLLRVVKWAQQKKMNVLKLTELQILEALKNKY